MCWFRFLAQAKSFQRSCIQKLSSVSSLSLDLIVSQLLFLSHCLLLQALSSDGKEKDGCSPSQTHPLKQCKRKDASSLVVSSLNAKESTEEPCLNHLLFPEFVRIDWGIISLHDTPLSLEDATCLSGPLRVERSCSLGKRWRTNRWRKKMFSKTQSKWFAVSD